MPRHPKKITKRCDLFIPSFTVFSSIHMPSHPKKKNKRCVLFIPFSLCSLHYRVRSRPYSLGFISSSAICSSLKLFACLDVSLREDLCMLRVKSTGGGMYCYLYCIGVEIVLLVEVSSILQVLSVFRFPPKVA
jgi:hypothetical protein